MIIDDSASENPSSIYKPMKVCEIFYGHHAIGVMKFPKSKLRSKLSKQTTLITDSVTYVCEGLKITYVRM